MNSMTEPLARAGPQPGVLPGGRGAGNVPGSENQNPNARKPKPANPKKSSDKKAHAKIRAAKSLLTYAKMWGHKVDEELAKPASEKTVFLN